LHFSFFFLEKFYDKQIEPTSRTNSAGALFVVQSTLQNDGKGLDVSKPKAPFGRRKKLPAAGSAAKMTTNRRKMKNENS
jgi:ribosomal protein L31